MVIKSIKKENDGKSTHEYIQQRKKTVTPFGIVELDELVSGVHAGELVALAGQQKIGKTSFALYCALTWAKAGKKVLYLSNEQTVDCLKVRLASQMLGYDSKLASEGKLEDDKYSRLIAKTMEIEYMGIHILDQGEGTTSLGVAGAYHTYLNPEKPDIVIIDNLNQLKSDDSGKGRHEIVKEFVEEVHEITKHNPVCIVLVCHLHREVHKNKNSWPTINNIAESASIAREVDFALLLAWPWQEQQSLPIDERKDKYAQDQFFVIVGANRHGPQGMAQCKVDIKSGQFTNRFSNF